MLYSVHSPNPFECVKLSACCIRSKVLTQNANQLSLIQNFMKEMCMRSPRIPLYIVYREYTGVCVCLLYYFVQFVVVVYRDAKRYYSP